MGLRVDLDDLEKRQKRRSSLRFELPFPELPARNTVTALTELSRLPVTLPYTFQVLFARKTNSFKSHCQYLRQTS